MGPIETPHKGGELRRGNAKKGVSSPTIMVILNWFLKHFGQNKFKYDHFESSGLA